MKRRSKKTREAGKLRLSRFMSRAEFDRYMAGETLVNETDHSRQRGTASTCVGFCWFEGDPGEAKHRLSGIVDFDVCLTVEVEPSAWRRLRCGTGRYMDHKTGGPYWLTEYCTTRYSRETMSYVTHTVRYAGYCPGPGELSKMMPTLSFLFT